MEALRVALGSLRILQFVTYEKEILNPRLDQQYVLHGISSREFWREIEKEGQQNYANRRNTAVRNTVQNFGSLVKSARSDCVCVQSRLGNPEFVRTEGSSARRTCGQFVSHASKSLISQRVLG